MQNNTIERRINSIKAFSKWLDKREINHSIKPKLWEKVEKNPINLICLERNELKAILNYKPKSEKEQRTKDFIVFLAMTGIRQIDLTNISKKDIINGCLDFIPQKTKKSNIRARIPLRKEVKEILERYNYKPPYFTPQYQSKNIQDLCANIKELKKPVKYIEVNGSTVEEKEAPKYTLLTSHCIGRKTFINLCLEKNTPLLQLMSMTAHNKIDTIIKSYAEKHTSKLPDLDVVFDF